MASNSWLKEIFGVGDISGTVPFLLTSLVLFAIWKFNRRGGNRGNTLMGSTRFGGRKEARELGKTGDLLIGRSGKSGKLLRYDGVAHLLMMAPTRSGKGVGTIIPNLLLLDHSVIRSDPMGENAGGTARTCATKGDVWCLRAMRLIGWSSACDLPARRWFLQHFGREPDISINSLAGQRAAIKADIGVGMLPCFLRGDLVAPDTPMRPVEPLWLIAHATETISALTRLFYDELASILTANAATLAPKR